MSGWLFLKSVVAAATEAANTWLEEGDGSENELARTQDKAGMEGGRRASKLFPSLQMGSLFYQQEWLPEHSGFSKSLGLGVAKSLFLLVQLRPD